MGEIDYYRDSERKIFTQPGKQRNGDINQVIENKSHEPYADKLNKGVKKNQHAHRSIPSVDIEGTFP